METPPVTRARPYGTLAAAALAVAVYAAPGANERLIFDRAAILRGELWRLWTGHFVHFTFSHLGWNLAVLLPAGVWAESVAPRVARRFLAISPLMIGLALLADRDLGVYAGLSGVTAGVLTLLALIQLTAPNQADRWFWIAVLGLLAVKIFVEWWGGPPVLARFSSAAIRPVPLAHVAGVLCAIVAVRASVTQKQIPATPE